MLQAPRGEEFHDRRRGDIVTLVVWGIASIDGSPSTAWIEVKAAAHRCDNVKRSFDKIVALLCPQLGDTFVPNRTQLLILSGLVTNTKQHSPRNVACRAVA